MAILVSLKGVSKSFGVRPLFEGVTFVVESNERIGLIGPNGAGKSTLLRILAGETNQDSGDVSLRQGLRVGFLAQSPQLPLEKTVEEVIHLGNSGEILSKLELVPFTDRKIGTLSGGWKKRVALGIELQKEPDLLLLDEPTNHLDIESILWLEQFLARAPFATVIITHDRAFLQKVTTRIVELDRRNPGGILSVNGDYATYLERKESLMRNQEIQEVKLKNKLRRETEWLRQGAKARTTKQQARIKAAGELKDTVEELETRNQVRTAGIEFESKGKKPKRLIEARQITKSLGGNLLFKDLDLFIGPGTRVGLLGTNGSGKSSLIRVLLGIDAPDSGSILKSDHLKVAYFEQNRDALDPTISLRKTLCPHGDEVNYRGRLIHIQSYLDRFLFKREQTDMMLGKLSGGEQARVLIAMLMLQEANVLVLDEPTNDLDVETLDILEDCLVDFEGAVILVTHDRYFLDQVATTIYAFPGEGEEKGKIIPFAELHQWEEWRRQRKNPPKVEAKPKEDASKATPKKRKLGFNETRELEQMESKIQKHEEALRSLENEAQDPKIQSSSHKLSEIYSEISKEQTEIDRLYARWAELEAMKG